jgi:hypothetical protein
LKKPRETLKLPSQSQRKFSQKFRLKYSQRSPAITHAFPDKEDCSPGIELFMEIFKEVSYTSEDTFETILLGDVSSPDFIYAC